MLGFLRKYQKIFFIVVAVVIVASFSFFGTHSQMQESGIKRGADPVGSLAQIIDHPFLGNQLMERTLWQSGMGAVLIEAYFDEVKDEMSERFNRAKHVQLYAHPQAPFLSVENLWENLNPELLFGWRQLKEREFDLDSAKLMLALYLAESATPSEMVKQYLFFQSRQYDWVQPDPGLYSAEASLFPDHTLENWFGRSFVRKVAQFFMDAASVAESKGYVVTAKEAREDFVQTTLTAMARTGKMSYDDVKRQLVQLGIDFGEAGELWQKVMVTKRYLEDNAKGVFVDPLVFKEFHGKAAETAQVEITQLPSAMVLKSEKEIGQFQAYLDKVGMGAGLPTAFKTVQSLTGTPFVEEVMDVEVAMVKKGDLAEEIGLSETWDFEEAHGDVLAAEFPAVGARGLDGIDPELRIKVDQFARKTIIAKDPSRIQTALASAPMEKQTLRCSESGPFPLKGIKQPKAFLEILREKGEVDGLSQDGEHFYRINLVEKKEPTLITYPRAVEKGILEGKEEKLNPFIAYFERKNFEKSDTLADQWIPDVKTETVKRSKTHPLVGDEVFDMAVDTVSKVLTKEGQVYFYRVLSKEVDERDLEKLLAEKQAVLANEAMCHYTKELLEAL